MSQTSVQIRVETGLKKRAERVLNDVGMDIPTAFRVFLKKVVATRSVPFVVSAAEASGSGPGSGVEEGILAALEEAGDRRRRSGPFRTAEELIAHLRRQKA